MQSWRFLYSKRKTALWWLLPVLLLYGCDATRHLPQGSQLIQNTPQFVGNQSLTEDELASYIKTNRNKRMVWPKVYLHIYNTGLAMERDSSWIKGLYYHIDKSGNLLRSTATWMREVAGDPPSLVNRDQLIRDCQNLESYYFANGFFQARVRFKVKTLKLNPRKARIFFYIEEGPQSIIRKIDLVTPYKPYIALITADSAHAVLTKDSPYNEVRLSEERERISNLIRNNGYFDFSVGNIRYEVDTATAALAPPAKGKTENRKYIDLRILLPETGQTYTIDSVTLSLRQELADPLTFRLYGPDLTPGQRKELHIGNRRLSSQNPLTYRTTTSTLHVLNYNLLHRRISLLPDSLYRLDNYRITQRQLLQLGVFSNVLTRMEPGHTPGTLHAKTEATMQRRFFHQERIELFQSQDRRINSNLPGLGGSLQVGNRNTFGRAEQIDLQLSGNVFLYNSDDQENQPTELFYQYGLNMNFAAPQFYLLDSLALRLARSRILGKHVGFHDRQTTLSFNLNQELNQQFQRQNILLSWQYTWAHSPYRPNKQTRWTSIFKPLSLTFVNTYLDPAFRAQLSTLTDDEGNLLNDGELRVRLFALRDFAPRFVSATTYIRTYSYLYNGKQSRPGWYMRFEGNLGGNLPWLIDKIRTGAGQETDELEAHSVGARQLLYSQFYRISADVRRTQRISSSSTLALRLMAGVGRAFNTTDYLPLEYRFFSGGTNSVRGWQSNTLGPGTYPFDISRIISLGGEIKFEANAEYRFLVSDPLEMALFVDAGNVWFWKDSGFDEPRGYLNAENLQLGIAGGIGFRFDFDFIILSLDIGQQLYAPDINGWVLDRIPHDLGGRRIQYNLGIGYPF